MSDCRLMTVELTRGCRRRDIKSARMADEGAIWEESGRRTSSPSMISKEDCVFNEDNAFSIASWTFDISGEGIVYVCELGAAAVGRFELTIPAGGRGAEDRGLRAEPVLLPDGVCRALGTVDRSG